MASAALGPAAIIPSFSITLSLLLKRTSTPSPFACLSSALSKVLGPGPRSSI